MKAKRTHPIVMVLISALALCALGLASGCSSPFGAEHSRDAQPSAASAVGGRVVVSAGSDSRSAAIGALTVFPDFETSAILSYKITLSSDALDNLVTVVNDLDNGAFPEEVQLVDVIPGTWTVTVSGYDHEDPEHENANELVRGQADDAVVTAGNTTSVGPIPLGHLEGGEGSYAVTVTWPTNQDVQKAEYRLDDGSEQGLWVLYEDDFEELEDGARRSMTIGDDARDAGSFWLTVRLDDGRTYVDELVYVYANLVSTETINLSAQDFPAQEVTEESIIQAITEQIEENIDPENEDSDFQIAQGDDGDYVYVGTGGGTLEFDQINAGGTISFEVRSEGYQGGNLNNTVSVTWEDEAGDEQVIESTVRYPYETNGGDDKVLLGAGELGDYGLDENGFKRIEFNIPEHSGFKIEFQGGTDRSYTFGGFEVSLEEQ